jgi:hypothetical protein
MPFTRPGAKYSFGIFLSLRLHFISSEVCTLNIKKLNKIQIIHYSSLEAKNIEYIIIVFLYATDKLCKRNQHTPNTSGAIR